MTSLRRPRFGVCLTTFGGAGNLINEGPNYEKLDWPASMTYGTGIEKFGYDSAWVVDHMMLGRNDAIFECWTTLSYLAALTKRIRLGTFVLCNSYRNPTLLAKMASTLDIASGGRLDLGIGAGWHVREYEAYGYRYPARSERVAALRESIQLIKKMFTEERTTFKGKFVSASDAVCDPKPIQKPHPPIMVGCYGEKMLRLTAELADAWNLPGVPGVSGDVSAEAFRERSELLDSYCKEIGRKPTEIERIWTGHVLIEPDRDKLKAKVADLREKAKAEARAGRLPEKDADAMVDTTIHGTPDECAGQMKELIKAGAENFVLYFVDVPSTHGMEVFANAVLPKLKR